MWERKSYKSYHKLVNIFSHKTNSNTWRENCDWSWTQKLNKQSCLSVRALNHSLCKYTCTQQHHASTPMFLEQQQQQPRHCLFHLVHLLFSNKTLFYIPNPNFNSNNVFPPQFAVLVLLKPLFLHGFSLNYYRVTIFNSPISISPFSFSQFTKAPCRVNSIFFNFFFLLFTIS